MLTISASNPPSIRIERLTIVTFTRLLLLPILDYAVRALRPHAYNIVQNPTNHVDRASKHVRATESVLYIRSEAGLFHIDPGSIGIRKKPHFIEKLLCISHPPAEKEISPPIWFGHNTGVDTKGSMAHPHSQEKSMASRARTAGTSNQEIESSSKTCLFAGAILP